MADGRSRVFYQNVHLGHTNEIGRLRLTKKERDELAGQISLKIPLTDILDGTLQSIPQDCEMKRKHLVTRKDLINITRTYNLYDEAVRFKDDGQSVAAFVEENQNIVLLYKEQGIEGAGLRLDDFALVVMTPLQKTMLQRHGIHHVSMDSTHGFK